jgi:hypothetical protein
MKYLKLFEEFTQPALDWLISRGEKIEEDWEVADEREVDYSLEEAYDRILNENESSQDTSVIKVRYKYAPARTKTGPSRRSRGFCESLVEADLVYRKEDIVEAGERPVNPGFGPGGSDTYDIWKYKGGARCRHYWMRVTYLKKDNQKISTKQLRKLINSTPVSKRDEYRVEKNDPLVAKLPFDMSYRGFMSDNPKMPSDAREAGRK